MSYFSAALPDFRSEHDLTQNEFADKTGLHQSQISRFEREELMPDRNDIDKITSAFGKTSLPLLLAYMLDQVPNPMRVYIDVFEKPHSARAKEPEPLPAIFERLPARVRKVIEAAALQCERQPEFVKAIESVLAVSRR